MKSILEQNKIQHKAAWSEFVFKHSLYIAKQRLKISFFLLFIKHTTRFVCWIKKTAYKFWSKLRNTTPYRIVTGNFTTQEKDIQRPGLSRESNTHPYSQ